MRLTPAQGREGRARLTHQLVKVLTGQIDAPGFQTERDRPRIEAGIALLADYEDDQAEALRRKLNDRLSRWLTVFRLRAPFEGTESVFAPDRVKANGPVLRAVPPELVLTRAPCGRNAELQAVFAAPDKGKAARLGLVLNAAPKGGYGYLLLVPEYEKKGAPEPAGTAGMAVRLQILRQDTVLREAVVVAGKLLDGPLTLRARRTALLRFFRGLVWACAVVSTWIPAVLRSL